MKVGFFLTGAAQATYTDLLEQVRLGDEAGFDAVWLRDRHFHQDFARHPFSSPFVVISHLSALFKRIWFGIGCKVLPLDHPLHVAEDSATVDVLSEGRLELGVARGGEHALCRAGFGVPDHETRGRKERFNLQYLILTFNCHPLDHPKSLQSMALFAQHLLPFLKSDAKS